MSAPINDPPPLRPGLLDDVMAVLAEHPAPDRRQLRWMAVAIAAACMALAALVFFAYGGLRDGGAPRPGLLIAATTVGSAALTAGALWLVRGRQPTGAPALVLFGVTLAVPIGLLIWKIAWSASVDGALARWPERIGIPCLQISLLSGLGPLAGLIWLRRRGEANHPRLLGAVFGVIAGGFAWVVTDLWCPVGHVPHLLLGHVLPLALFALAGMAIGARWLRVIWKNDPPR